MKLRRTLSVILSFLFLVSPFLFLQSAHAISEKDIVLLEPPHRDLNGVFIDDELAVSLLPTGRLGQLVFSPVTQPRTWLIDAALIEDVEALAVDNIDAQNWLLELKSISAQDPVIALPYGHPNVSLAKRLAPTELRYYFDASKTRLQVALGRDVAVNHAIKWGAKSVRVPANIVRSYTSNRRAIALMSTVVPPYELDTLRLKLAYLLAPGLDKKRQLFFSRSVNEALTIQRNRLRIVPGKYRLTSEKEKVPITLVNDFNVPITVGLQLLPLNARIQISGIESVVLAAKSKTQLLVPITVVAPGTTTVLAQFVNSHEKLVNDTALLIFNASVISPAVAWFTTGAAILLFLAALTQSVRRVRRSRK